MTRSFSLSDEASVESLRHGQVASLLLEQGSSDSTTAAAEVDLKEPFSVGKEAAKLFHIALPSILIQFSLYFIFPVSASSVGRVLGTVELGGFSLGSLVGNMSCLSILEGALSAADTLMPRAYGAKRYEEVGRLAIRGFAVLLLLLLPPILPMCLYSGYVLESLGQDAEAAYLAQEWIQIYFLGVPPSIVFRILMRFLLAQNKPWPLVYASTIPSILIHPFLLNYFVPRMGLPGSAVAIVSTQWLMSILLVAYLKIVPVHHPRTWPGLSVHYVKESLSPKPLLEFFSLSMGGVLSLSEWWFWEINCFIAGSFGVIYLVVHTIAYNLVPLLFMLPLGIMLGLTVRMGSVIAFVPHRAKLMAAWSMGMTIGLAAIVSTLLHVLRFWIIGLFTTDAEVIYGCNQIWPSVCMYIFFIYIFGINNAILRALGLQWRLATISTSFLYFLTLPAVVYFAIIRGGGLFAQWSVLPFFYFFMQIALVLGYTTLDWTAHSDSIRKGLMHAAKEGKPADESTALLV